MKIVPPHHDLSGKYSVEWKVNRIDKHGGDFLTFGEKDQVHSAPVTYSYADPRGEKAESIKIVIVGAPGVGKTAIAQDEARTTRKGHMRQVQ